MVSLGELTHPAGNPGPWRDAASAWRRLATDLRSVAADLGPSAGSLHAPAWSGQAADAFSDYWHGRLGPEFQDDLLSRYSSVADRLDQTAEKIEEYNQLAQAVQLAIVVGVAFSVVTAGIGTALGAGETAVVVAEATVAYSAMNVFLGLLQQALIRYATYWVSTFALSLATNSVAIAIFDPGHNPLDSENWSLRGVAEAANSATIVAGMGAPTALAPVADFAAAHSLGWDLGTGFVSGAVPSVYNLLLLEHLKLVGDPRGTAYDAWWKILLFGGTWSVFNAGVGRAFAPPAAGEVLPPSPHNPADWIATDTGLLVPKPPAGLQPSGSGLLVPDPPGAFRRQPALIQSAALGFLPSTGLRSIVPFPNQSTPQATLPPPPVGQTFPAPIPPAPIPPAVGSGTRDVHPGDSLWSIAAEEYGNPTMFGLIAQANGIAFPYTIHGDQVLAIPRLPPAPGS